MHQPSSTTENDDFINLIFVMLFKGDILSLVGSFRGPYIASDFCLITGMNSRLDNACLYNHILGQKA